MSLTKCRECGSELSSNAPACPHCGNPLTDQRLPLLTKPAGVFVQLLGLALLLVGGAALAAGSALVASLAVLASLGLFILGRQTHQRAP